MTAVVWAGCLLFAAAVAAGLWRHAGRIAADAVRDEATLRQALAAHAEDMTALVHPVPDGELEAALKEWQARQ